jgi:ABC-type polar amino acid transport system ATPase subunit
MEKKSTITLSYGEVLVVTHKVGFAREAPDKVVFMDEEAIVEVVPPREFFTSPQNPHSQLFLKQILTPATR